MDEIKVQVCKYPDRPNLVLRYVDPLTGKQKTKSAGTADEEGAQKAAGKWEAELREGRYAAPSRLTWADFRQRFKVEKLAGMPPATQVAYTVALDHLQQVIAPDRLCKLTAAVMSRFVAELRKPRVVMKGDKKITKPPMKPGTIARHLRHAKAALRWAERQGMMHKAPTIEMPKLPKGQTLMRGRPITGEEFDRMVAAVPEIRPADAAGWVRLLNGLWLSGLRLSEALDLSWNDDAPFSVDTSGKRPVFRIFAEAQKARRDELLPMTPDFASWLLEQTPEAERVGRVFKLPDHRTGKQLLPHRAGQIVIRIGNKAGVVTNKAEGKYAGCHDLRRAFGTRWAKRVMPAVLKRLMRHANIATTMSYYVDLDAADVAAELWSKWGGNSGNNPVSGNISGNIAPKVAETVEG